jgi:predicted dinucleotide-binding enzyme
MKISIIGSGNVGSALAQGLLKAEYQVSFGCAIPLQQNPPWQVRLLMEQRLQQ